MKIVKVESSSALKGFIDYPHDLYKDDVNYVPEIYIGQKSILEKKSNPFFKHSNIEMFLAMEGNKIVGRIAAIRNNNHIEFTGKNEGFFGFFDVENDYKIASELLKTVVEWGKKEGLSTLLGPVNPSTNDTCGVLIEGYDSPPVVMMTYNKPYYGDFLDKFGFKKSMDLLAYRFRHQETPKSIDKIATLAEERLNRKGIVIRKLNMKKFKDEVKGVKEIYNSAWDKNWGFVPMTSEEFDKLAADMKMILDPDFAFVAEKDGKMVGFSLTIPNVNEIVRGIKRGRLLPTGIFKLLFQKSKVKSFRIITLGVIEEYRKSGIDLCFYTKTIQAARDRDIDYAEASWILENNVMMNRILENINGVVYKKYRIYEYAL